MILAEYEAKNRLEEAGIPVVETETVENAKDAVSRANLLGYPLVLKLSSALHSHKTEIGGVFLNLRNEQELQEALGKLAALRETLDPSARILMEPMVPPSVEWYVGIQRNPGFGLVLALGLGGTWLELFGDVSFRLLPASRGDLEEMVEELACWPKLCRGFRALAPVNRDELVDSLERVASMAIRTPGLEEMDLNPVVMHRGRWAAADARMVLTDHGNGN